MMPGFNEEYRQEVTNKLIEALKNGTAPWQKPWNNRYMPVNAISGKPYSGMNSIILSMEGEILSKNNRDPRWITARQAGKKGWMVKAREKPVIIVCIFVPNTRQNNVKIYTGRPIRRVYALYHASQIKGIPAFFIRERDTVVIDNKVIDTIIFNASARVYEGGDSAYYVPEADIIRVPSKDCFSNTEAYYSTLLHELVHWTGHSSRLDRIGLFSDTPEAYAREELIAKIASIFLTSELGITQTKEHFEQHAAYVKSWIKILKSNPNEIFNAAKEARKTADLILSFKKADIKLSC